MKIITDIITHRGLDPARKDYFIESSLEAFTDQLSRGYGLEFDAQFTKDGGMIVVHDLNLKRLTEGRDLRPVTDLTLGELLAMDIKGCHLTTIPHLLGLIKKGTQKGISAFHIKTKWQEEKYLDEFIKVLRTEADLSRLIVFDLKIEAAKYLKARLPALSIAVSVSHPYDIERFNKAVGYTLISLEETIANRSVLDWVWLDEWDRADKNGGTKSLYNKEVFDKLREHDFKIALVTPELHTTTPGLLGGECHPDGKDHDAFVARMKEIIAIKPDALCTDHPDEVKAMVAMAEK